MGDYCNIATATILNVQIPAADTAHALPVIPVGLPWSVHAVLIMVLEHRYAWMAALLQFSSLNELGEGIQLHLSQATHHPNTAVVTVQDRTQVLSCGVQPQRCLPVVSNDPFKPRGQRIPTEVGLCQTLPRQKFLWTDCTSLSALQSKPDHLGWCLSSAQRNRVCPGKKRQAATARQKDTGQVPARLNTGSSVHPSARRRLGQSIPFHHSSSQGRRQIWILLFSPPLASVWRSSRKQVRERYPSRLQIQLQLLSYLLLVSFKDVLKPAEWLAKWGWDDAADTEKQMLFTDSQLIKQNPNDCKYSFVKHSLACSREKAG